jgi:hypothetical protein
VQFELVPDASVACYDNRQFLGRAVRYLVGSARPPVRQIVDIGSGLPTLGQVHSVAHLVARDTKAVYVDYDPEVLEYSRRLLADEPSIAAICRDLRQPEKIMNDTQLLSLIDLSQPVAILLVAISHVTADNATPDVTAEVKHLYEGATAPSAPRTLSEILSFFDGLEIVTPGLVNVSEWRNDFMPEQPGRTVFYAGVGRKR